MIKNELSNQMTRLSDIFILRGMYAVYLLNILFFI